MSTVTAQPVTNHPPEGCGQCSGQRAGPRCPRRQETCALSHGAASVTRRQASRLCAHTAPCRPLCGPPWVEGLQCQLRPEAPRVTWERRSTCAPGKDTVRFALRPESLSPRPGGRGHQKPRAVPFPAASPWSAGISVPARSEVSGPLPPRP